MRARREKVNKSEIIRRLIKENPGFKGKEIVDAAKEEGCETNIQTVYTVKAALRKKLGLTNSRKVKLSSISSVFDSCKEFVNRCGSLDEAINILNALKEIRS